MTKMVMTGNYASAYGARACRAEVVSAYPITPQTSVVEKIATLCSSGEMDAQFVKVESEHSAMATLIAASLILASGITQAQSFDYEKAVGSSELFSTLATDQAVTVNVGNSNGFAYQKAVGSHDLFPTLIGNSERPHDAMGQDLQRAGWFQRGQEGRQEAPEQVRDHRGAERPVAADGGHPGMLPPGSP